MNLLHMKYAIEVAKAGSLNKAAEVLMVAQPNISRSIKELESHLGIVIFERSTRGMTLTIDGEQFIEYAQDILKRIGQLEKMYTMSHPKRQIFSLCGPRASYISKAFVQFTKSMNKNPAEFHYRETNCQETIHQVVNEQFKIGIIRYSEKYDKYFKQLLEEKGLQYELVTEFTYKPVLSQNHALAAKEKIYLADLKDYVEVTYMDSSIPVHPTESAVNDDASGDAARKICICERAGQFGLLSEQPETYMWCSMVPYEDLERYQLVQRSCTDHKTVYKDVLIYKKNYRLSPLDQIFITELCNVRRKYQ